MHLEACWKEACAPRQASAPTVISTFSGCGGSSLGYAMAGYRELLAVEWEDDAVRVFNDNFVNGPIGGDEKPIVYHGDIAKVSAERILEQTGLEVGELDVFDGSPPCQGFSTAGRRVVEDERNTLFLQFARLITGLQPKVFLMENVKGMVMGDMKPTFVKILEHLRGLGYKVQCRLIVASWLGVPQRRPRLIFIGTRNDLNLDPHTMYPKPWAFEPTVRQGIGDLQTWRKSGPTCAPKGKTKDVLEHIRPGRNGTDVLGMSGYGLVRARWDRPSNTLVKLHNPRMFAGMIHPSENRYMGINEIKRLGSFPKDFRFGCETPKWWKGKPLRLEDPATRRKEVQNVWARIGNSVPPLMMREIALEIAKRLENV